MIASALALNENNPPGIYQGKHPVHCHFSQVDVKCVSRETLGRGPAVGTWYQLGRRSFSLAQPSPATLHSASRHRYLLLLLLLPPRDTWLHRNEQFRRTAFLKVKPK